MKLFSYDPADEKSTLAARARTPAQRVFRAVQKLSSLQDVLVPTGRTAKRSPPSSTPTSSRGLENRVSIHPTRLDLGLALRAPQHQKRRLGHAYESYMVATTVLRSGTGKREEVVHIVSWSERM